jgi:DNA-binding IclR family transcriptional regulator
MTKPKSTAPSRIVNLLTATPDGLRVSQIAEQLSLTTKFLAAHMWQLKKDGTLTHDRSTGVYKLSPVNTQVADVPKAPKVSEQILHKQIAALRKSNEELSQYWSAAVDSSREFERKYFDALGVIAYLEAKLEI